MLVQYADNFTKTGLNFINELNLQHWREMAQRIRISDQSHQWWIGDWLVYGEKHYKKSCPWFADGKVHYQDIAKETGFAVQTLKNCSHVSRSVPTQVRKQTVSWNHHALVAKLQPAEQVQFLELAERENLSVSDLRKRLPDRSKKLLPAPAIKNPDAECQRLLALFRTPVPSIKCDGTKFTLRFHLRMAKDVEALAALLNKHYTADEMPVEERQRVRDAADKYRIANAAD